MPECAEACFGEDWMADAKRNELARRQSTVACERFEDVAYVRVGYSDALFGHAA